MPIRQKNPVNEVATPTLRSKSPLKWSYPHLNTQRFGEIDPVFVMDTVPNDDIKLVQRSVLNTYTLKAPMLNKVTKHYGYYSVPKCAILPHAWSKIFVNPKKGDDVNGNFVNATLSPNALWMMISSYLNFIRSFDGITADNFLTALRFVILALHVYGPDGLPLKLRVPFTSYNQDVSASGSVPFLNFSGEDPWYVLYNVLSDTNIVEETDTPYHFTFTSGSGTGVYNFNTEKHGSLSLSDLFDLIMNVDGELTIEFTSGNSYATLLNSIISSVFASPSGQVVRFPYLKYLSPSTSLTNIQRLAAYQMICATFATRDTVDDVYTAELYRQNMESLYISILGGVKTFEWNGISIIYDWCSGYILSQLCSTRSFDGGVKDDALFKYFANLLYPQKSLRYGDLFNSARTEPFAVGDTDIDVSGNKVSVIDTVYNILKEKFLNLVNNVPNTVARYSQAVFGVIPNNLPAEPYKLGECSFDIKSNVNINTAQDQGTQQNNLTGMYSGLSFSNHHFTQDEIIIGVSWYVMELPYIMLSSPFAFKFDRYDGFLPQLQNIGSVPVVGSLLNTSAFNTAFGYLPNDYEYKQDYGDSVGAFVTGGMLPGWSRARSLTGVDSYISPWFIRPRICEMDDFYKSLTGVGSNYFHFICSDYFEVFSQRPMEYIPTVLGNF